ncbi:MAG: M48 family metallopeptidase [Elusimicrobia bacterium]|nr:M48 family metallopeptidase [Elusimicrobiota bacterium]
MKKNARLVAWILPLFITACATIPITGRKSLRLIPEDQEIALGVEAYKDIMGKAKVSSNRAATAMVQKVGERIARVSDRPDYSWEYSLIEDPKNQNAFCLPGGKVAVYTGLLPITKNETGLAVVLSHEIAHAIAKHGAERMSQEFLIGLGGETLEIAMKKKPAETRNAAIMAYGLGATLGVVLPFSRSHESEADRIGLIYMARAGYDPREALEFWKRMESASKGQAPPGFLSTHPSHADRVRELEKWMPDAVQIFNANPR